MEAFKSYLAIKQYFPHLRETLYVFLTVLLLYIVLRICLSIINLLFEKLPTEWRTILDSIRWPVYWVIILFSIRLVTNAAIFPDELKTELLVRLLQVMLTIALIWLSVRTVTMCLFSLYFHKVRGISVPKVLPWIVNKLLYLVAFIGYMNIVYEFSIGDLIVTTAIIFVVLSIAFQKPLGNFIADVSASFQKTFSYKETIQIADFQGEVIESNWRYLRLLNTNRHHVTIPIRQTLEFPLVNFNRPETSYRTELTIAVDGSFPPNRIEHLLTQSMLETGGILKEPPPAVHQKDARNREIFYTLTFSIQNYQKHDAIVDRVRSIAWYKIRREGPRFALHVSLEQGEHIADTERQLYVADIIRQMNIFSAFSKKEVDTLAELAELDLYGQGERLFNQGDPGDSLYIICSGSIAICINQPADEDVVVEKQVATLEPGTVIGEISLLTGELRTASAIINEESELICINKTAFSKILVNNPSIIESLTDIMLERQMRDAKRAKELKAKAEMLQQRQDLLSKIKTFFQI